MPDRMTIPKPMKKACHPAMRLKGLKSRLPYELLFIAVDFSDYVVQHISDRRVAQFEMCGHVFQAAAFTDECQDEILFFGRQQRQWRESIRTVYFRPAILAYEAFDFELMLAARTMCW